MRRRYSQFVLLLGPDAVVDQRLGVDGRTQGQAVAVGAVGAHRLVEKLQRQERARRGRPVNRGSLMWVL